MLFIATVTFSTDSIAVEEGENILFSIELSTIIEHYDIDIGEFNMKIFYTFFKNYHKT